MNIRQLKNELQNILSGKNIKSYDTTIEAVTSYLRRSKSTSALVETKLSNRQEEKKKLVKFATENNLFYNKIEKKNFVSEGAEQKVYIKNEEYVIKLNDAIYYTSWKDYFYNLLLHNYFFTDTTYKFLGFYIDNDVLFAVVKQPFVKSDNFTNLKDVNKFLIQNGFENTRNHDYYHPELGIILEDLHDENVLTQNKTLYFIDTVFYIKPEIFWDKS